MLTISIHSQTKFNDYNFFKEKAEGKLFADYAREKKNENMLI